MEQEYIWDLIALNLSGEASYEDIIELNKLQNDFPEINYYVKILSALWQTTELVCKEVIDSEFDKLLQRIKRENL